VVTLALEEGTTLHVGELAVLQIPSQGRDWHFAAAGNALALVHRSGHRVVYRAVRPGQEAIVIAPHVKNGECISCVTRHYFIEVMSQK